MLEFIGHQVTWFQDNYVDFFVNLSILVMALEGLVRLTPTKKDDGFMERIASYLNKAMELLKVPNVKREPGKIAPSGVHEKKDA